MRKTEYNLLGVYSGDNGIYKMQNMLRSEIYILDRNALKMKLLDTVQKV